MHLYNGHIYQSFCIFKDLDISTCTTKNVEFTSQFEVKAKENTTLNALVGFFDIGFNQLQHKVCDLGVTLEIQP